jgi:hypothetical protein
MRPMGHEIKIGDVFHLQHLKEKQGCSGGDAVLLRLAPSQTIVILAQTRHDQAMDRRQALQLRGSVERKLLPRRIGTVQ